MKAFRAIIALLLIGAWLPATSHALLEHLEVIHQVHSNHDSDAAGSSEHDADNHDAADGKCALSSPHSSLPLPKAVALPMLFCALGLNGTFELHVEPQPSGLPPPGPAPPELSHRWQFEFRTALPARAPSLVS